MNKVKAAQYTMTIVTGLIDSDLIVITNETAGGTIIMDEKEAIVKLEELLEQLRK